jgi:hypothetical protein
MKERATRSLSSVLKMVMTMISLEKFEKILSRLNHAHNVAKNPDFKAIWLRKVQEIQRTELAEMKLNQQEGYLKWR